MASLPRPLFALGSGSVQIGMVVPIHMMTMTIMPDDNGSAMVMMATVITDADTDSPRPYDDSCCVRGRRRHRHDQAESRKRSE